MYILGILNDIGNAIMDGIRTFMLTLCDGIYRLIYFTFYIFEKLGTASILQDGQLEGIFTRMGLIIGIFMVFRVTFAFIQYIVDPDTMLDKNKGMGNIVKKIVIAIVLLGSTTSLFKLAYRVQDLIVDSHIISKVIFNNDIEDTENFGGRLSAEVFTAFYRLNDAADTAGNDCEYYFTNDNDTNIIKENIAQKNGSLDIAYSCITERDNNNNYIVDFDGGGFIALVMGAVVLYTVVIFTIQVGVRLVQLAYLQIIAPIPIIMYITPKGDDYLKKWGTQCLTTFLDFFLRTAIIYFAVAIIQNLMEAETLKAILSGGGEIRSGWQTAYVFVIMVIAILVFAKKVPALLKEIFPSLGGAAAFDYGLSFKKQVVEPLKTAYNSPLGWGLKLAGAGVTAIDRHKYGLPKTRNKFQQALDKLMPGRAEMIKNRNAGGAALSERELLYEEGRKIYNKWADHEIKDENGKLRQGVFQNSEYAASWQKVADAKKLNKKYEAELAEVQARLSRGEITVDSEEYKNAVGNAKAASARLEAAKQDHDNIRKIYTKDARVEDAYNYYHDLQFGTTNNSTQETSSNSTENLYDRVERVTGVSRENASSNGAPTAENSLLAELASQAEQERLQREFKDNIINENTSNNNNNNSNSSANTQQQPRIITEEHVQSRPREETNSNSLRDEYESLINQYNNETDPNKKADIRKQLDDFGNGKRG